MAAPRKGKEVRQIVAIRLEPSEKELLIKHFGGVQAAVDHLLRQIKPGHGLQKITKTFKRDIEKKLGIKPVDKD